MALFFFKKKVNFGVIILLVTVSTIGFSYGAIPSDTMVMPVTSAPLTPSQNPVPPSIGPFDTLVTPVISPPSSPSSTPPLTPTIQPPQTPTNSAPITPTQNSVTGVNDGAQTPTNSAPITPTSTQVAGVSDIDTDGDGIPDNMDPNTEITTNTVAVDTTLGGDLTVDGASFTIPNGITVDFDFVNNKIIIKSPNGKILIEFGGKIN